MAGYRLNAPDLLALAVAFGVAALTFLFGGPWIGFSCLAVCTVFLFMWVRRTDSEVEPMHFPNPPTEQLVLASLPKITLPSGHVIENFPAASIDFGSSSTTLTPQAPSLLSTLVINDHTREAGIKLVPNLPVQAWLAFTGCEPLREGRVFMQVPYNYLDITAVYVRNIQVSSAKALRNVRVRIEYLHNGTPDFVVERACWWARYPRRGVSNPDTIDLEANEEQAVPVFMVSTAKEGTPEAHTLKLPQSAAFDGWKTRCLGLGRWTLRIIFSADFCQALKGEIQFTILENHLSQSIYIEARPPYGFTRLPIESPTW